MKNQPKVEPVTLIVSMALTALTVALMEEYEHSWAKILVTLLFIFSGQATIMLYWSTIIPLVKAELETPITSIKVNKKFRLLLTMIMFYCRTQVKILLFRASIREIKLFGYISGFMAFLIFYIGMPVKIFIYGSG